MKTLIALILFSNLAFAHSDFVGNVRGTSQPCSLKIQQVYYINNVESPENLRADIVAHLEDHHHHSSQREEFFFTIQPGARPNLLSGTGSNNRDQINVSTKAGTTAFKAGTTALNAVEAYAVRWWHINHFHSAQCVNLKRVKE